MEILIDIKELRKVSESLVEDVGTIQELASAITTTINPLRSMKSPRLDIYMDLYKKANLSLHESMALLLYISNELKEFVSDLEKADL